MKECLRLQTVLQGEVDVEMLNGFLQSLAETEVVGFNVHGPKPTGCTVQTGLRMFPAI